MSRVVVLLFVAAVIALTAGTYAPRSSQAYHSRALNFGPPTEPAYSNSSLTTGWHDADGLALDWGTTGAAYARAWGYAPQASAVPVVSGVVYAQGWGNCYYTVKMDLYDWNTAEFLGTIDYVHTLFPQSNVAFYGSNGYFFNAGAVVSYALLDYQNDTCTSTGPHVHERHERASLSINTGTYRPWSSGPYNNANLGNWTRAKVW